MPISQGPWRGTNGSSDCKWCCGGGGSLLSPLPSGSPLPPFSHSTPPLKLSHCTPQGAPLPTPASALLSRDPPDVANFRGEGAWAASQTTHKPLVGPQQLFTIFVVIRGEKLGSGDSPKKTQAWTQRDLPLPQYVALSLPLSRSGKAPPGSHENISSPRPH